MRRLFLAVFALLVLLPVARARDAKELPKPLITGLKNPESVCLGGDGRVYVTVIGEFDIDGDGGVWVIDGDKAKPFAKGMDDPKGVAAYVDALFVADKTRIWRVDRKGKAEVYVTASAFPTPPLFLNDLEVDRESGALYVSDSGDLKGAKGAVYRVDPRTKKVETVLDSKKLPTLKTPNGLVMDGASHLLVLDFGSGDLLRIKLVSGSAEKIAEGFDGGDGLAWDKYGRLFVTSWKTGKVWGIPRPGEKPVPLADGFESAADLCLDRGGKHVLIPDMKAGTITAIPTTIPGWEVDETPLPLEAALAFPDLKITGWKPFDDGGKQTPVRPICLMPAGDGSKRLFLATQQGVIHAFANDPATTSTTIFADISSRVRYSDDQNEEGLLGMALHPNFKKNGEFFLFYTDKRAKLQNVVSRFRVSKDDPDQADAAYEEELLRFPKPYWNHDGGTICFGPDGYLYVTHGDGGLANDPHDNGQNPKTLLGKVMRIDVDHKAGGKNYAIPKDNPFAGKSDAAPEIWAYGLRNIWRMAFDSKTGELWAADVGQNLFEEIDIITKGGNYGWNVREGLHPFGNAGIGPHSSLIEPIWEYHHDVGRSITGGQVYRGKQFPELNGAYLYADYITGKINALWYDKEKKRVVANRPIRDLGLPILSFGQDEKGEVYLLTSSATGKGIYGLARAAQRGQ